VARALEDLAEAHVSSMMPSVQAVGALQQCRSCLAKIALSIAAIVSRPSVLLAPRGKTTRAVIAQVATAQAVVTAAAVAVAVAAAVAVSAVSVAIVVGKPNSAHYQARRKQTVWLRAKCSQPHCLLSSG